MAHPERFINPLLLVVLGLQAVQTALTTLLAEQLFGSIGVAVGVFVNVVVVFVLAEAAPKTWAIQHPERAGLLTARPVRALARFWPLKMISRGLIGLTNVLLPGKGLKQGPVGVRGRAAGLRRGGGRGRRHRGRGAQPDPAHPRVR